MIDELSKCPVCLGRYVDGTDATKNFVTADNLAYVIHCETCGVFRLAMALGHSLAEDSGLSDRCRAAISHKIRIGTTATDSECIVLSDRDVSSMIERGCVGVTPAMQAINVIKFIGDYINDTGERASLEPKNLFAIIGAPSPDFAHRLVVELEKRGHVTGKSVNSGIPELYYINADLTLDGWERYEAEKKGEISGNYGFIAMKFGDESLEDLVKTVIKPAIGERLPFELRDVRDVSQAGIIDNIMRAHIREAAFVIVDLTHDNSGAYWEAGYAEGLGKPVIYICEKEKFEEKKTHFDTNHCTTIMWSSEIEEEFSKQLVATIRRSLNLF